MISIFVLTFLSVSTVIGQFDPLVNVESCTMSKLVVSTYGAMDDGLIYIQGQDDRCKHTTISGVALYQFEFADCNIEWEMLFRIVVQKKSGYQTGADKVIPIFCVADRSDLIVSNANNAEKADDGSVNVTIQPSAKMSFYKVVAEEEVSGKEVKLSDTLIMALQLDNDYIDDLDIKARYCIASGLVIIENYCSTDTDLFPNFSRLRAGYLMSEFGAFRPTNLAGSALEMNFTCILEVCRDACTETFCGGGQSGWGRKKRDSEKRTVTLSSQGNPVASLENNHHRRQKRQDEISDIDVGAKVKIVEKYTEIQIVSKENLCINAAVLIAVMILLASGFVGFAISSCIFYRKWTGSQAKAKELQTHKALSGRKDSCFPGQLEYPYKTNILQ